MKIFALQTFFVKKLCCVHTQKKRLSRRISKNGAGHYCSSKANPNCHLPIVFTGFVQRGLLRSSPKDAAAPLYKETRIPELGLISPVLSSPYRHDKTWRALRMALQHDGTRRAVSCAARPAHATMRATTMRATRCAARHVPRAA